MNKKICVIIPANGKAEKIESCVTCVLALNYPALEIIIVDDGMDKSALAVLDNFKEKVKILKSGLRGPSFARNLAAKATDADLLAFTDADCIVDKEWIGELVKGIGDNPLVVSCGGIQKIPEDASVFEKKVFSVMKKTGFIIDYMRRVKDRDVIEVNHNPSCNVVYKRDVFLKEGGFLEGLWPGEDVELDYRLIKKGYKLLFNPAAIVYHYRPTTIKMFARMMYRYGKAQGWLVKRYGLFRKVHLIPFVSILLLVAVVLTGMKIKIAGPLFFLVTALVIIGLEPLRLFFTAFLFWNYGFLRGLSAFAEDHGC